VLTLAALLLLGCSSGSEDERAPAPTAPAENPARGVAPTERNAPAQRLPKSKRRDGSLQAGNGYYQYVDESGRVRFAPSLDAVPERQRGTAGHIFVTAPEPAPAPKHERAAASETRVVLYTTSTCPYCRAAKQYLDRIGQEYVDKNIEDDPDAHRECLSLTGRDGVPVIVVGDRWMEGWNPRKLDELLAEAR
jgi:glutaredoxin 3